MAKMCVIGSFNIDIIASVDRFPVTGETVVMRSFDLLVGGGKGANQAVALGKLGADVMMVGKLGDQYNGPEYLDVLKQNNVSCEAVEVVAGAFPGTAFVAVDGNRDNILFIHPGTNAMVDRAHINKNWDSISTCDTILFQLEIPMDTNVYAMAKLHGSGRTLILDPAPAVALPQELYVCADFMTPNEVELAMLTGTQVDTDDDFRRSGEMLLERGAKTVIAKAGKRGAYIITNTRFERIPGYVVDAVDPTAAGDSFNAGFALGLSEGRAVDESVRFANAVAALSTTAMGAQSAMPTRAEVEAFIARQA